MEKEIGSTKMGSQMRKNRVGLAINTSQPQHLKAMRSHFYIYLLSHNWAIKSID